MMQDKILFPASMAGPMSDGPWRDDAAMMTRAIGDGQHVTAWLFPAPAPGNSTGKPAPLVVYAHGNAELIDNQQRVVNAYHTMGISVLLAEYRGYGHSDGKPGQRAIVDDTLHFLEQALQRDDVDASRVVYHGRSLGGAVVAQLAKRREPSALILKSTFTHVGAFAWRFGMPPFLVKHPFRTKDALPALKCPVLLFHGETDPIIPAKHSERLHARTPGSTLIIYAGVGHNDFPGSGNELAFWADVAGFLAEHHTLPTIVQDASGSP